MPSAGSRVVIGGVNCWDEGTKEHFVTYGRSTATRTILCAWMDRVTLLNNIFAISGVNLSQENYYSDALPYNDAPGLLYFDSAEVEQVGGGNSAINIPPSPVAAGQQLYIGPNGLVAAPYARIRLTYASRPWDQQSLSVTNLDFGLEEQPLGTGSFEWASGGAKVDIATMPSLKIPTCAINITQYNQPTLPFGNLASLSGYVNSAPIFGFGAGTVLLNCIKTHYRITFAGTVNYDVTYPFVWKSTGWNKFFNPATGGFEAVQSSMGGNPPFPSADLNQVFTLMVK